jgi:hypothetical protein
MPSFEPPELASAGAASPPLEAAGALGATPAHAVSSSARIIRKLRTNETLFMRFILLEDG